MTLIEGIGDEVVLVVAALALLVMLSMAWLSTHVRERPRVDVVVLDQNRIMQLINRVRTATTNTLEQTPIGYIVRPNANQNQVGPSQNTTEETNVQEDGQAAAPGAAASDGSGSNERVSVVYAHLVPDHSTNCPLRQRNQDSQNTATTSDQTTDTLASQVPSSESPKTSDDSSQDAHAAVGEGSEQVSSAATNPDTSDNTSADPTTAEGVRNRRLAFFVKDRSTVDDSQISARSQSQPDSNTTTEPSPAPTTQENQSGTATHTSPQTPKSPTETRQDTPPRESAIPEADLQEGHIRIRLKYLDDRQRLVQARPGHTISQFKRQHFEGEISENMSVRLIYNGQELHSSRTLQSYNVEDSSVIHCLFSRTAAQNNTDNVAQAINFDMGTLVFPLFGLILALIWYCRFAYRSYFNAMSTFSLVGITFLFLVAVMASFRTRGNHEHVD